MIESNAMQRSRTTMTGENGGYSFGLLPPAQYELRFHRDGFTDLVERVRVSLASVARVDVELQPAPLSETITIESDRARAPADALVELTVRASDLQKMPGDRDIATAVGRSASVNALGPLRHIVIAGAPSWDSLYLVDGVAVSEYLSGQPQNLFIEDAIDEVAVQTSAISSEYGRFTGGVVTAMTKRGGDEYRTSFRETITNPSWTLRTPWPDQPRPLDHTNLNSEATMGGFIAKDRLWFFAASRKARMTQQSFTAFTNIPYDAQSAEERWQAKLTAQLTPAHSVIASYMNASLAERNAADNRTSGAALDLASVIPNRWQPANLMTITYEGLPSANTWAEIHSFQKHYALRGDGGRSSDRILGTLVFARNKNGYVNAPLGCGICGDDARNSNSWSAKTSHYSNTRFGNHTLVAGGERFREYRRNPGTRSASNFTIPTTVDVVGTSAYPVFDSTRTTIVWTSPHPAPGARFNSTSAYANDRWDITSRVGVNIGMRYDRNHAADSIGQTVANDGAFSPRLSATFDLRNDGRHRLVASFGRYVSKIVEGGAGTQLIGISDKFVWGYAGPPVNINGPRLSSTDSLARLFAWFDSIGGTQNRQYLRSYTDPISGLLFPHSLQSPAVDERTIGYIAQFPSGYWRADYVMRDWHHFYAERLDTTTGQTTNAFGEKTDVAWVINDDRQTRRSYRGLQLQADCRIGRTAVGGGYTLSALRGNDSGEEESTGSSLGVGNLPSTLWYPEFLGYPQRTPIGYLRQDERHRARLWFSYEALPVGRGSISAYVLQSFDSGHPYSAVADIDPTGRTPGTAYAGMHVNPGYVLNQTTIAPYFFSARGAFRTDDVFSTDVALTYELPYRSVRLLFKGEVLNLFDRAAVVAPGTDVITRYNGGESSMLPFNPFIEVPIQGVHYLLASDFGKPTGPQSYQRPRAFQLSLSAHF